MRVDLLSFVICVACTELGACPAPSPRTTTSAAPAPVASPTPAPTPEPEPAPPPPATGLNEPDPNAVELACRAPADCMLVSQGCGRVTSVHRDHAAEAQRRFDAILALGECGNAAPTDAVYPTCEQSICRTRPRPHPEVRRCRANRDCTAIDWGCQWAAISQRDEEAARRLMPTGPGCPGIMPQPPDAVCTFGFCAFTDPDYGQ